MNDDGKDFERNGSGLIAVLSRHFTEETEERHEYSHLGKAGAAEIWASNS
jgi:hypothetical protein